MFNPRLLKSRRKGKNEISYNQKEVTEIMTGKIEVKVKLGLSKSARYNYIGPSGTKEDGYPFWYLEVTGGEEIDKNGKPTGNITTVKLTPSWFQLKELIRDVKVHEIRVDKTRERKNDADRWDKTMQEAITEAQTQISDFEIPKIYYEPKLIK